MTSSNNIEHNETDRSKRSGVINMTDLVKKEVTLLIPVRVTLKLRTTVDIPSYLLDYSQAFCLDSKRRIIASVLDSAASELANAAIPPEREPDVSVMLVGDPTAQEMLDAIIADGIAADSLKRSNLLYETHISAIEPPGSAAKRRQYAAIHDAVFGGDWRNPYEDEEDYDAVVREAYQGRTAVDKA
jgi:hypothetical protein